jgi:zinc finger CCHC domain-containing protein 9
MTRFARRGGVAEKREDKKKAEEATAWSDMLNHHSDEEDEEGKEEAEKKKQHQKDYEKKIEHENSNLPGQPFKRRKLEDFEKPVRHYFKFIDPDVLDELSALKKNRKITMNEYFQKVKQQARSNQRRLQRIQERDRTKTCFKCRNQGHSINDCPMMKKDIEQGTGVCYKCGSTEHSITACKVKLEPGGLGFLFYFLLNQDQVYFYFIRPISVCKVFHL